MNKANSRDHFPTFPVAGPPFGGCQSHDANTVKFPAIDDAIRIRWQNAIAMPLDLVLKPPPGTWPTAALPEGPDHGGKDRGPAREMTTNGPIATVAATLPTEPNPSIAPIMVAMKPARRPFPRPRTGLSHQNRTSGPIGTTQLDVATVTNQESGVRGSGISTVVAPALTPDP